MPSSKRKLLKASFGVAIISAYNVIFGLSLLSVSLSIILFLVLTTEDAWILVPLRKRIYLISKTIAGLVAGEKDLTKRIAIAGNNEISMLGQQFNTFRGHLHSTIGQSLNTANQVASASTELSRFSSKMAGSASEQSSQISQIASAMDKLNATVNEVSRNTQVVAGSAKEGIGCSRPDQSPCLKWRQRTAISMASE